MDEVVRRLQHIEDRLGALEDHPTPVERAANSTRPGDLWALERLQELGGDQVLFTGAVELPDGRRHEWQQAAAASALIEEEWSGAEALAALGHPVRLALLRAVLSGTTTAADLAEQVGTTGRLYHHVRQLVSAGWLRSPGRGRYEVPAQRVVPLLTAIAISRR